MRTLIIFLSDLGLSYRDNGVSCASLEEGILSRTSGESKNASSFIQSSSPSSLSSSWTAAALYLTCPARPVFIEVFLREIFASS
jgi:hypothetical protein